MATVDSATGAVTVAAWDSGSTIPVGGFSTSASVFKWQREYWNITGPLDSYLNGVTNFTLRFTGNEANHNVWLDDLRDSTDFLTDPLGSTISSSINYRYFQYRSIFSSVDPAISATLSAVTVNFLENTAPATPTLDFPNNAAIGQTATPILKTTSTDPNSDNLQYKIQICTDSDMTTNCLTFDQTASAAGWSNMNADGDTTYTSGRQGIYTVQTPLSYNTTYYWRSYAIDPHGTNSWGSTQVTPRSFTTNQSPAAPTLDLPADDATGVYPLPTLKTTATDINGNNIQYKIEICSNVEMNSNCQTFDQTATSSGWSGMNADDNTTFSSGTQASYTLQSRLNINSTYYWRSYAIDPAGSNLFGPTQATPFSFVTNNRPNTPSLDVPSNGATGISVTPNLQTTATDPDGDSIRYKIQLCTDQNMSLTCQTFDQTASSTGWSGMNAESDTAYASGTQGSYAVQTPLLTGTIYYWRSYAIDQISSNTFSDTQSPPYSFTVMPAPTQATTCLVEKNSFNTQITVKWSDNSSVENGYQIWKVTDGGAPVHLTPDLDPNTTQYVDTSVSSGHTYGYLIRALQLDGANTIYSNWCATVTSDLHTGGFTIF